MVTATLGRLRTLGPDYLSLMPNKLFDPCIPARGAKVAGRPEWIHEIKHDGYRLIVRHDGNRVRLCTPHPACPRAAIVLSTQVVGEDNGQRCGRTSGQLLLMR
jgi:hypothetical protein